MVIDKVVKKYIYYFLIISFFWISVVNAQFREEIGTLETMYETRARAVLNTVLRPFEYSLVVSVDIDRDESRLEKLQQEVENDFLPGMPGGIGSENPAFANQLYELKNKIDIHLVLSQKISKEKEKTIANLLTIKLHLDEKNGDSLTIARTDLPNFENDQAPSNLPELSWKMWGMLIGLLLLIFSVLFYFLSKKSKLDEKPELAKKDKSDKDEEPEELKTAVDSESISDDLEKDLDPNEALFQEKQQIISLATQYPIACVQALTEHLQNGNEKDILILCDTFGWQAAKKLFADFSPRVWGRLGVLLQNKAKFKDSEVLNAFQVCGRIILKKFLEMGEYDSVNPFGFFWKLNENDRKKLLASESPVNIALICFHGSKDQIEELMESLDQQMSEAVTIAITKIEKFSEIQIKLVVEELVKKLQMIKQNPEKPVDGIQMAAQLLRSLPAEKELAFFDKLAFQNPDEAFKIRQTILLFPDIKYVAKDIINEAAGLLDLSTLTTALRKNKFPEVTLAILKALPTKKSYMIEKDLDLDVLISDKEIALSQREIINSIMAIIKLKKLDLIYVLQDMTDNNVDGLKSINHKDKATA